MALAIGDEVIKECMELPCAVCLHDGIARGQMIVDWNKRTKKTATARIVMELDIDVYIQLLIQAVQ